MAFRQLALAAFIAAALCTLSTSPARAQELLRNGGFEQGLSGWSSGGASTSGCPSSSGDAAVALGGTSAAFVQQVVGGPIGSGAYRLRGFAMAEPGATNLTVSLIWLDESGSELITTAGKVIAGPAYAAFTLQTNSPAGAHSLRARIARDTGSTATVCIDAVSLDGPAPLAATPRPTPSPTATVAPPTPEPAEDEEDEPSGSQAATEPRSTLAPRDPPSPTPPPTVAPPATPRPAQSAAAPVVPPPAEEPPPPEPTLSPAQTQEVLAAVAPALPTPDAPTPAQAEASTADTGVPSLWLAAAAVFIAVAAAGSYLLGHRARG